MALPCAMRTPVDPQSEIKGTIYGIEGSPRGSFETDCCGRILVPTGEMRLGPLVAAMLARLGLGGR